MSSQRGGGSKDVWVLPAPDMKETPVNIVRTAPMFAKGEEAPSRLVENLYWFGRYSVRCEDKARLMRATLAVSSDEDVWRFAANICRALGVVAADIDPDKCLRDVRDPYSLVADVKRLGWCASQVRSRLSGGFWRASVALQHQMQEAIERADEPRHALDRMQLSLTAMAGYAFDHMTRDEGWRLMRIGRRLERMQFLAQLLGRFLASDNAGQQPHVEWLLAVCDSARAYRSHYVAAPSLGPLLDLLLRDAEHPHAVPFQHLAIAQDLAALAAALGGGGEARLDGAAPAVSDEDLVLMESDVEEGQAVRQRLAQQLQALSLASGALSDRISMRYFSHVERDAQALVL